MRKLLNNIRPTWQYEHSSENLVWKDKTPANFVGWMADAIAISLFPMIVPLAPFLLMYLIGCIYALPGSPLFTVNDIWGIMSDFSVSGHPYVFCIFFLFSLLIFVLVFVPACMTCFSIEMRANLWQYKRRRFGIRLRPMQGSLDEIVAVCAYPELVSGIDFQIILQQPGRRGITLFCGCRMPEEKFQESMLWLKTHLGSERFRQLSG